MASIAATIDGNEYTTSEVRAWGRDPKNAKHLPEGVVVGERGALSPAVIEAFKTFQAKKAQRSAARKAGTPDTASV